MRYIVFGLLAVITILITLQFIDKKGTRSHIVRGYLIGIFSLVIVVINTVEFSIKRGGLVWDGPFIIHLLFGMTAFSLFTMTAITGSVARKEKSMVKDHGNKARLLRGFLILAVATGVLIRIFR